MDLTTFTYHLKAQAGDTVPQNRVGAGEVLTGGTIALVDTGGGVMAWRFSGSPASAIAIPSRAADIGAGRPVGGGMALVVRVKITTVEANVGDTVFGYCVDTSSPKGGLLLSKSSGTQINGLWRNQSASFAIQTGGVTHGAGFKTYALRLTGNDPARTSSDFVDLWVETVGRSGTTPDLSSAAANSSNQTPAAIIVNAGSGSIDVAEAYIFPGEPTDAQMAALADDLAGTMAVPTPVTFSGTVTAQTGAQGVAFSWAGSALSSYFANGTAPLAYSILSGTLPAGLAINSSTGVISGTPTVNGSFSIVVRATDSAGTPTTADTGTISFTIAAAAATAITLTGPSGGQVGVASAAFTVGANGTISGSHTVTPSDGGAGGTFSPTTVTISAGTPTATFTYTPSTAGARTISATDAGGYTAPATISYTASATAGTLTVSGIKNGSGTLLASTTLPNVVVIQRSNRAALLALTAQATNGAGALVISSGVLAAGVACMVLAFSDDGTAAGAWPATVV